MSTVPGPGRLFTIGHSNHDPARLVELLRRAGVTAVGDVRSQPYSRRHPHFNRAELEQGLERSGIAYAFLGNELGGRPRDPRLYDETGRVDYECVRATRLFQQGIARLAGALEEYTVALLCSEEDPLDCHRGLMIAPALTEQGIAPSHLRGDGSVESTEAFEARLLAETKLGAGLVDGLFASTLSAEEMRQLLREAYRHQARARAFRMTDPS